MAERKFMHRLVSLFAKNWLKKW